MKERPILFSGPMVRALLAGTKTQTRRICKLDPDGWEDIGLFMAENPCPYGVPGDRLWVRETWRPFGDGPLSQCTGPGDIMFAASATEDDRAIFKFRPSIFMPRWATRITLEVTGVRVERVNEISEADAQAEGARECDPATGREVILAGPSQRGSFRLHFLDLFYNINKRAPRGSNPWVWVVEFRKLP